MIPFVTRHCRAFPPETVTRRSPREVSPHEVGLEPERVETIWREVERYYAGGLHPALGVCIRYRGQVVLDRTIGHLRGNAPGERAVDARVLAHPDALFNVFSATKAVTAMLVHLLDDRGQLHLDDAVAEYIPEFARHGKGRVTLRHVLTHRAGLPALPQDDVDLDLLTDTARIVSILCDVKPASIAGRRLAYHAITGGYILAEVVQRVSGRSVQQLLESEVATPMGLSHFRYGVAPERRHDVALNALTGTPARGPLDWFFKRALGVGLDDAVHASNDDRFMAAVIPSGNLYCSPNDASRFFEMLRNGGTDAGREIFSGRTVRRAVAEQSYLEFDQVMIIPVRYGMGFMLGSDTVSIFGPNSPAAFGHLGFTNTLVWADPEREMSVAFLNSGKPFFTDGFLPWQRVVWAISEQMPRTGSR